MFTDGRSKKVIFLAHCLLNQNAISDGTAGYPAAHADLIRTLLDAQVGIVQMPCPELCCLGLDRGDPGGGERPVVAENTRIRWAMSQPEAVTRLRELSDQVVWQIQEYQRYGFTVLGIVGVDRSPCCGVNTTSDQNRELPGRGVFIDAIRVAIEAAGLPRPSVDLPMQIFPLILVGSLLPAVTEEAVFRGTVAQGLAGGGVWKASLISGALFALFHMNPAQTVHQFLFGALLAALALRSGSTWTASIVHLFNNLTAVALSFVPIPDDLYAKMLLPAFFVGAAGAALCFFGYVKTTRSRQYEKEETLLSSNALVLFVVALLVCAALWVFSLVAE